MASILLVGIANGSFKTGSSLSTGPKDRVLAAKAPYSGPVVKDGPDLTQSLALPTNSIAAIFSSSSHWIPSATLLWKELDAPWMAAAESYSISRQHPVSLFFSSLNIYNKIHVHFHIKTGHNIYVALFLCFVVWILTSLFFYVLLFDLNVFFHFILFYFIFIFIFYNPMNLRDDKSLVRILTLWIIYIALTTSI